jgi:hypothetical protein
MSNNVIQRAIPLTADWQPLAAEPLVGTVDVSCPPGNRAVAVFQGDDGSEVPWIPGEWHQFVRVDLSRIRVRGAAGDQITVIGGTW